MALDPLPSDPLVSVLVANYNYALYLPDMFDSVLKQSYANFEICVCDDGSSDNSVEVISQYASRDTRIKYVAAKENRGFAAALNSAWGLARGEIVCLLDSDDVWLEGKLAATVKLFRENSSCGMATHPTRWMNRNLTRTLKVSHPARPDQGWWAEQLLDGVWPQVPMCSGLSARRQVAARIFPINPNFKDGADAVFCERAILLTEIAATQQIFCYQRLHGKNLTTAVSLRTNPAVAARLAQHCRDKWQNRHDFVRSLGQVPPPIETWVKEGAVLILGSQILNKQHVDRPLIDQVGPRRQQLILKAILLLPVLVRPVFLKLWWKSSGVKTVIKAFLSA